MSKNRFEPKPSQYTYGIYERDKAKQRLAEIIERFELREWGTTTAGAFLSEEVLDDIDFLTGTLEDLIERFEEAILP